MSTPPCGTVGPRLPVWLALLPFLALACNGRPSPVSSSPTYAKIGSAPRGQPAAPRVIASISKVKVHWGDGQQLFTLILTNTGNKPATIHAIVYATNEQTKPPRRAISPPTAYQWFELTGSTDGSLTAQDIEKNWKTNVFVTARGGKLPFSWQANLQPGESREIEAAHVLDERSPHPATKGKKLAHAGFLEYRIWLFTANGKCFDEQTVPAQPAPSHAPAGDPPPNQTTTRRKEPPPTAARQEEEAARALRLARYYLEHNKPELARAKLQLILRKYPDSAAAAEAKELLAKISG